MKGKDAFPVSLNLNTYCKKFKTAGKAFVVGRQLNHSLTPPQRDGGANQKGRSKKTRGLR